MQSMQYLFNKGFSFSDSHLALFLPYSNGEQQLYVDLYGPVKKGNITYINCYINEKFSVYCWDVFPSNMNVYYTKGKWSNLSTCSAVIFQLQ